MIALAMFYIISQALAEPVTPAPSCAPPPPTITVPCAPNEGCLEKWIFVEQERPVS